MSVLRYSRVGAGETLVLLHGIGSYRGAWDPVVPALAAQFDVLAVDLPGFGESPPLPTGQEPTPAALAAAVAGLLDELGIDRPHVAGNSLGGWVALELAAQRPLASIALLSPAGLWPDRTPRYARLSLRAVRGLTHRLERPLNALMRFRAVRSAALAQVYARPGRMTPEQARRGDQRVRPLPRLPAHAARDGRPPLPVDGGDRRAGHRRVRLARPPAAVPHVPARRAAAAGATVVPLPGCGHVPMGDDPAAVAALLASATRRAASTME